MVEKNLIGMLTAESEHWDRPVLSVYLNVDPSQETNLNQGYLRRYKTAVRDLESQCAFAEPALEQFHEVARSVEAEIADYEPTGKSLIVFRTLGGGSWTRTMQVPVRETVDWADAPVLDSLAEILDEYEHYGVVLFDRSVSRIFSVHLGEIEEIEDFVAHDVSHTKTTGADHRWSDANFQRRADEHVKHHARETARALADADRRLRFDRLLLAGPTESRESLRRELPARLRRKIAASVALDVRATPQQVLTEVEEIHRAVEQEEELSLVDQLMSAAASDGAAVIGLRETVRAVAEGRVRELIVSHGFRPGWDELDEATQQLYPPSAGASEDLRQSLVRRTIEAGGRVEFLSETASDRMEKESGGIGAILRYG